MASFPLLFCEGWNNSKDHLFTLTPSSSRSLTPSGAVGLSNPRSSTESQLNSSDQLKAWKLLLARRSADPRSPHCFYMSAPLPSTLPVAWGIPLPPESLCQSHQKIPLILKGDAPPRLTNYVPGLLNYTPCCLKPPFSPIPFFCVAWSRVQ